MANGNGRSKRRWIKWGISLAVIIGLLTAGGLYLQAKLKPDYSIDPSKLSKVETGDIARSVVATGKIEPRVKVEVKSKASGIVEKLLVDYGQYVKQGDILAELDKEELRARMREARASLAAAQAAEQMAEAAYERTRAEAEAPELPFLKSSVDRASQMHKQGLISRAVLEEAERMYEVARNKQMVALRNVTVTKADIARAKAQAAQAQASLERAEEDLRNSTIVSPMDGLVLSRDVEVGDAVSSILVLGSQATLVMTLGDVSDVYVLGKVDQADIGKVSLGQAARITVESYKDKKFSGNVIKISPLGEEKENVTTFEVRVSIKNPGGLLKANMSANAEVVLHEKKNVLLAPESAVLFGRDGKATVEVPDPTAPKGRRAVPVQVGITNGVKAELLSGLKSGDQVILQ
ncbi:MAG: efflux RND transporter periplasmic adaptor subunit [Acidobacteria bacterium]|nr:efflux RND transporter periplasmic adaptor subunit [Acidobacteriota bacterium]